MLRGDETGANLMLIGLGHHAMFMYYPAIEEMGARENVRIRFVVDLEDKRSAITNYLSKRAVRPDGVYLLPEEDVAPDELPAHVKRRLDQAVDELGITGVIISTEPLSHVVYAKWALRRHLSILMDKPISSRRNVSNSADQARALMDDYCDLAALYQDARMHNPRCVFSLMAQRRYHPAFEKVRESVREVFERTGCPVTSIINEHSDGEWRMPSEIIDETYHPLNQGYGVLSHSGYHCLDSSLWFMEAASDGCKRADGVEVFANLSRPSDFIGQIGVDDLTRLFGERNGGAISTMSEESFAARTRLFGELDGFVSFDFKRGDQTITLVSTNLIHNSLSQRGWVTRAGQDLLYGNGRVRHEMFNIQQGPFQSIRLYSFQSYGHDARGREDVFEMGGALHLEVHVFRNASMFPDWKALETFNVRDLGIPTTVDGLPRGHLGIAKERCIVEYLRCLSGREPRDGARSDLLHHYNGTALLSGIYQSAAARLRAENPLIRMALR
jgi:predicted dehydrogenase